MQPRLVVHAREPWEVRRKEKDFDWPAPTASGITSLSLPVLENLQEASASQLIQSESGAGKRLLFR